MNLAKRLTKGSMVVLFAVLAGQALEAATTTVVVPPGYNALTGTDRDSAPLGAVTQHFQQIYGSSLLGQLAIGDTITAVGFRIPAGDTTLPAQTVPNYSIWMGQSAVAPSGISMTFSDNRGADFTLVRSGSLTIAANQFSGGAGLNAFGYIDLGTPYVFKGGNLLLEISYDAFPAGGRNADTVFPWNTANPGVITAAGAVFSTVPGALMADEQPWDEAIITAFKVVPVPVPEPSGVLMVIGGFLLLLLRRR